MTPQPTLTWFNMHMMHISNKSKLGKLTFEMVMQDATAGGNNSPSPKEDPVWNPAVDAVARSSSHFSPHCVEEVFTIPLLRSFINHNVRLERANPK